MAFDYSVLFKSEDGIADTWREVYDDSLPLSLNVLHILEKTVLLPHDFYDLVAAYFMLPSALCKVIPYLFFYGQSGSGKSTIAKVASNLHGTNINSSSDTFAAIRNSLDQRRKTWAEVAHKENPSQTYAKAVERNTIMVWDDVSSTTFISQPELYNMFKFGCDRKTDKIIVSSKEVGENIEFRCFCPKVFSSITPLHLDDRFRELKRRMIVIPCKRVEELSEFRKQELGLEDDNWQGKLLDLDSYDWKGFSTLFQEFWDIEQAQAFVDVRKILAKTVKGFSSQQRSMSLDLMAAGIASGIWSDENIAVQRMLTYWRWFKHETEQMTGLSGLLREFIRQEEINAFNGDKTLSIDTSFLRTQVKNWVEMGWLYENPKGSGVKELMLDLGMRLKNGKWVKG